MSLSLWREWIEIAGLGYDGERGAGLSLYGESGLKYKLPSSILGTLSLSLYGESGLK